jgi:ribosomal protein S18 acetylase RimI-like enzyme
VQVEIRKVQAGDEALFDDIAEGVFDEPIERPRLAAYLVEPRHHMVVALCQGQIVGQVAAVVHSHPARPSELYVDDAGVAFGFRRRGIARRLMDEILALGRSLGCREAWLGTEPDNQAALGLYEVSGGEPSGRFVMVSFRLA